ncbi:MAG: Lrp/AsnC family transcriptional regulator [Deltaproteobacteria bacterium]|nr:Lrp/AsnC family transcriptional regulator [Deltaproteobacteria bacterium]
MITEDEIKIARLLQGDISLEERPFAAIGARTGMEEGDVIDAINRLRERGLIRRFGAIVRHREAGYRENAMVLWAVPEEDIERKGEILTSYREISHCYGRTPPFEGKYTLYSMLHTAEGGVEELVRTISETIDISDYQILRSEEEYKKTSMEYF